MRVQFAVVKAFEPFFKAFFGYFEYGFGVFGYVNGYRFGITGYNICIIIVNGFGVSYWLFFLLPSSGSGAGSV